MAGPMATSSEGLPATGVRGPQALGAGLVRRARAAAATTPGRMRVISLGVLACVALAWALGFSAVSHRQQGIRTVGTDVQPVVRRSVNAKLRNPGEFIPDLVGDFCWTERSAGSPRRTRSY